MAGASRPAPGDGRPVETRFEIGGERVERGALGTTRAGGRHHPRTNLHDDFLPRLRVAADVFEVERVEREPGRFQPRVVTRDAVPREQRGRRGSLNAGAARRRVWAPAVCAVARRHRSTTVHVTQGQPAEAV